jgi:hypothetical protein
MPFTGLSGYGKTLSLHSRKDAKNSFNKMLSDMAEYGVATPCYYGLGVAIVSEITYTS